MLATSLLRSDLNFGAPLVLVYSGNWTSNAQTLECLFFIGPSWDLSQIDGKIMLQDG